MRISEWFYANRNMKTIARLTVIEISHDGARENTKYKAQSHKTIIQQK